jgi:acetoin utilization protein AcuB
MEWALLLSRHMSIADLMTRSPVVIPENTSIARAWEMLRELDVRHMPVVNADGELSGMLSDRDFGRPPAPPLMNDLLGAPMAQLDAPVSSIMSAAPVAVADDVEVRDVVDIMIEHKVGAVPVVDPQAHVIGIISYVDVLRTLVH